MELFNAPVASISGVTEVVVSGFVLYSSKLSSHDRMAAMARLPKNKVIIFLFIAVQIRKRIRMLL